MMDKQDTNHYIYNKVNYSQSAKNAHSVVISTFFSKRELLVELYAKASYRKNTW